MERKMFVRKINGVRGFMPTTYAVYDCNTKHCYKIFLTKKEAEQYIQENQ